MEANEYQVGGDHYNEKPYQHWDFVIDTDQHYLIACATKYLSRWRKKNGIQDLRKATHYLTKAEEHGIQVGMFRSDKLYKFIGQLNILDGQIIVMIMDNNFEQAQRAIADLITEAECGPTAAYVNQG